VVTPQHHAKKDGVADHDGHRHGTLRPVLA
jgi:hypothetical protein